MEAFLIKRKLDPYNHFNVEKRANSFIVTVGEPDMLNPNSIENIGKILQAVGSRANIRKYVDGTNNAPREWILMENDGGILILIYKFIFKMITYNECNTTFDGKDNFDAHLCEGSMESNFGYEFDWIVPQSGLLHVEINAGKSFFKLCWDVFMKEVCKTLGFATTKALAYAKKKHQITTRHGIFWR